MNRHILGIVLVAAALFSGPQLCTAADQRPPNIIILFADDLGYGDLACYGHPTIRTPSLDRLAAEGMRFTDFYAGSSVCTPSRTCLLTGRYAIRSGMTSIKRRVLFPNSAGGLPPDEVTIAEALKTKGYATACYGKWHLGHLPQYLPTSNGFDEYHGVPYSNDMDLLPDSPRGASKSLEPKVEWWNVPLMKNDRIIERPADQRTLTKRATEQAVSFIERSRDKPFFIYMPYSMPHVPLFATEQFAGKSPRGLYGDVVEELDWSVGQIMATLTKHRIAENTLVFFTSDNGPWLTMGLTGGSAGLLREGKGSTWEGGQRVPAIAWWPGTIKPGQTNRSIACNLDLFTTALKLAGAEPPADRPIDGVDLTPVLLGKAESARDHFFYYRDDQLWATRKGPWKVHYVTKSAYGQEPAVTHDPPLLFNLDKDPSEQHDMAAEHPQVLAEMAKMVNDHKATVKPVEDQLVGVKAKQ